MVKKFKFDKNDLVTVKFPGNQFHDQVGRVSGTTDRPHSLSACQWKIKPRVQVTFPSDKGPDWQRVTWYHEENLELVK
jgi:hypothetical protein